TFAANAYNEQGAGKTARDILLKQIWSEPLRTKKELEKQWQFQIISSYLQEGKSGDTDTTIKLFIKEFGASDKALQVLQARYFLMNGMPEKVSTVLNRNDKGEAYALYLYGRLQSKQIKSATIMNSAIKAAGKKKESDQNKFRFWLLSARAALKTEYYAQYVKSMEQATQLLDEAPIDELFYHNADRLWLAYESYALFLAGKEGLVGYKDDPWFALADKQLKKRPERARAIHALLASGAKTEENRIKAHKLLVKNLTRVKNGADIVQQLYMHSSRFGDSTIIPLAVRRYLADKAVKDGKIKLASTLVNGLEEDTDNKNRLNEILRRARIHIMAGNTPEGTRILQDILVADESIGSEQLDRVMQVVFDLQTVNEHFTAYSLFELLYDRTENKKRKREMLYWMADSKRALTEYDEAARLYLLSAYLNDNKSSDPWAESAKFQAARALSDGGYIKDSYELFNKLLRSSSDPRHRQVLKQELEKLRFRE
ncbi:MAG: hypothetical protein OEX83_06105, partial [Gammaproteobacteria bacterium]|nr:hypothetical protein [Gammaproteobacteria bacterium]